MQIGFFPWLQLKENLLLGTFTFRPFKDENGNVHPLLADIRDAMTTILQGYVDIEGRPIENCTFVSNANRQPVWDLQDEDHETINRYAKILTLAAFSKNDYNTNLGCYANSTHFQFLRQRFTTPVDFITYSTRRRDGSTIDGGYRHGQIHFPVPAQAKQRETCASTRNWRSL